MRVTKKSTEATNNQADKVAQFYAQLLTLSTVAKPLTVKQYQELLQEFLSIHKTNKLTRTSSTKMLLVFSTITATYLNAQQKALYGVRGHVFTPEQCAGMLQLQLAATAAV